MDRNEQKIETEKATLSPLAQDKTYGEKRYDLIFGKMINFWSNLFISAGFAFWVKHYSAPLFEIEKKDIFTGKGFKNLQQLQENWIESMKDSWIVGKKRSPEDRRDSAESIINVLTLLTPGHFVMIPSVWLGEKYKASIVQYFDRKHYGEEAMSNPDLIARHEAIATAEKPTLLGTFIGRVGAALVNVGIARTIGSEENWLATGAKKKNIKVIEDFKGIDHSADKLGIITGEAVAKMMPEKVAKFNNYLGTHGYGFSNKQKADFATGKYTEANVNEPYMKGFDNLTRYFVQDIMYTLSTAAFIRPVINTARHILPGMTYKPKIETSTQVEKLQHIKIPQAPLLEETSAAQTLTHSLLAAAPASRVSQVHKESTISKQPDLALTHAG